MRVSVRLKSLWATALVTSLAILPSTAFGQNDFVPPKSNAVLPAATNGIDSGVSENETEQLQRAKQLLLNARRALAQGNLEGTNSFLDQVKKLDVDFKKLGDSPVAIQDLIDNRSKLVAMGEAKDPNYNIETASFFLTQANSLIQHQDYDGAKLLIEQAKAFPVDFTQTKLNPEQLMKLIAGSQNNESINKGRQLMSRAQLAFDRQQYNDALAFIEDAKALDLEPAAYGDMPQPWKLELKIQEAMPNNQFDPAVKQAQLAHEPASDLVSTAGYTSSNDKSKNVSASNDNDIPTQVEDKRVSRIPATAQEMYDAGIESLRLGDKVDARMLLEKAWEQRDSLDQKTQQSIQDQLLRLSSTTNRSDSVQLATSNQPIAGKQDQDNDEVFRQLQKEVFSDRSEAERLVSTNPREALEKMSMIRNRIGQSALDAKQQQLLLAVIDRDMSEVQAYIDRNISTIETAETNLSRQRAVETRQQRSVDVQKQMQKLVDQFNYAINEQRFAAADLIARQAYELDPDSPEAVLLHRKATEYLRQDQLNDLKAQKEQTFHQGIQDAIRSTVAETTGGNNYIVGPTIGERGQDRVARANRRRFSSDAEAIIFGKLQNEKVQGDYSGTIEEVIGQLSRQANVNMIFDRQALENSSMSTSYQIDVPIQTPISLKSALQIILEQQGLTYVVGNEIIKITTKDAESKEMISKVYEVGDLVSPIRPPVDPNELHFMSPPTLGSMGGSMNVPVVSQNLGGSQMAMNGFGNYDGKSGYGPSAGRPTYITKGQRPFGGISIGDYQPLLNLITNTIAPESWDDTGSLQPYPQNLSLVISNTQDVHDQIQELLKKLRDLNDVQIVVEVRFVTLQDDFFERVGIDFDFNINDSGGVNLANDVQTQSGVVGVQPVATSPATPTVNNDIEFLQGAFGTATPLFGGFNGGASAANIGFAILSDIEVFFLLQAAQGNTRTNITQAPTVTMFNGASASINDTVQRPFVTSVVPVVGDFAVAHQPIISVLPEGTNLDVTATASSDRKYVRVQLAPRFTQIAQVDTFTFDGSQTTEETTNSVLDRLLDIVDTDPNPEELQTRTTGVSVQLPSLAQTTVSTVVSVPDGGTVLLGGIKRVSEGRNEFGVPFLSKLPYMNRLFKNVSIGHDTNHLMMMVKPTIIIQSEQEEDQVGLTDE